MKAVNVAILINLMGVAILLLSIFISIWFIIGYPIAMFFGVWLIYLDMKNNSLTEPEQVVAASRSRIRILSNVKYH